MNLTNFSVRNYQFTLVMFIMIAVVGVVTLLTMPRAEDPQINPPSFPIVIIYPGTSPTDMEELIVKPVENKMFELENIDKITTNISDGVAVLQVDFKYGENVDNKYQEVVREMNALRGDLPKDIANVDIRKIDPTDVKILQLALVSETAPFQELEKYADDLKDDLEKVPDLKKIIISGVPEQVVRVDIKIDKLAENNIPLSVVAGSVQGEDANIPGGSVTAGSRTFNVKTSGRFKDVEDIANTVVYNANGKVLHLKDVANVGLWNEEEKHITRLNGHRCVLVNAAQKKGANIHTTQQNFAPVIATFEKTLPLNIRLFKNFDQADNVAQRLSALGVDFLIAICLVLITLLPLGTRASLIVMIAIPLSLALGLVGLNLFGYSLNQLSIVGLVVALGLLVDDSIVVVENIERWLREGHSPNDAAIKGTKQITLAVLGCTATLGISFMPLIFLPGGPGEFIRGLPMAVICSVAASLLVSLTVVPFLASRLLKERDNPEGNIFLRGLKRIIHATYSRLMIACLQRPLLTLIVAFSLFAASLVLFPLIGFRLFPTSEKPIFLVNVRLPLQTSLLESDRISRMVEDSLRANNKIIYFTTNVGKGNPQIYYNVPQQENKSDFVQFFVQLDSHAKPAEKVRLIETMREQFQYFPFAKVEVKDFDQGPPIEAPISIRIFGDDLDTLRNLAFQVENIIRSDPGAIYISNELNVLKTDVKVKVNREKARTLGVQTVDIDKTIRLAIAGQQGGSYTDSNSDDHKVIVDLGRNKFASVDLFDNLFVNGVNGIPVPLRQFASVNFETSPGTVNHFDKNRFAKVTAYTRKNVLANNILKNIQPKLDALKMPAGYYYKLSGEAESEGDAFGGGFITVILLTIFLFTAVLILQFKTFKGILIVLSVIPLGVVGGVSMLWLTGNPMSFIAIIGFIGLAGIEVKNSILLVDFTNQLRENGETLEHAIEHASEVRFLPVILTSLTAIGGLIPLAFNPNPQISPLALVLIGGLISSTILSRIVTPVMYKLIPPSVEKYN
jgi:multidrug efflux pump subunit AcrB